MVSHRMAVLLKVALLCDGYPRNEPLAWHLFISVNLLDDFLFKNLPLILQFKFTDHLFYCNEIRSPFSSHLLANVETLVFIGVLLMLVVFLHRGPYFTL